MADSVQRPATPDEACVTSELLARVRAEYLEMPGLCLTPAQAARLWGLTPNACAQVLEALVAEGALVCTRDVRYVVPVQDRGGRQRPRVHGRNAAARPDFRAR